MKIAIALIAVAAVYFGYVKACAPISVGNEKYRKIDVTGFFLPASLTIAGQNVTNALYAQAAMSADQVRQRILTVSETVAKKVIGDLMYMMGLTALTAEVERQITVDSVKYEPITCQDYRLRSNISIYSYNTIYICILDNDTIIRNVCDNMTSCNLGQFISIPSQYRQIQITLKITNSAVGTWTVEDWNRFSRNFQNELVKTEYGTAFDQARITVS